jgi:hypothetical protein
MAMKHSLGQTPEGVTVGVTVGLGVIVAVGGNKLQIVLAL